MLRFTLHKYRRDISGASIDDLSDDHATLEMAISALRADRSTEKDEAYIVDTQGKIETRHYLNRGGWWQEMSLAELQNHVHKKLGYHEAYPKLCKANEELIDFAENICKFFKEEVSSNTQIIAAFRAAGKMSLADLFAERSKKMDELAENGYTMLIRTVHFGPR